MIDVSLEQVMQASIAFAAITHVCNIFYGRVKNYLEDRRWRKQDAEWAVLSTAAAAMEATPAPAEIAVTEVIAETKKSKKNG